MAANDRTKPNILITGTPGTGKTTTASMIAERVGLQHIEVSDLAKREECYDGYDEALQTHMLDEDKLLDKMEPLLTEGGYVVDYHGCDLFPERWFDLVLVLRTSNTTLYDRLQERGYSTHKISENVECEIMQVLLDEAKESYAEEIVHEVQSENIDDMDSNVERVAQWVGAWKVDHSA